MRNLALTLFALLSLSYFACQEPLQEGVVPL